LLDDLTFWIIFIVIALSIFVVDIYVTDNRKGKIKLKNSLTWSGIWIGTALFFCLLIFFFKVDGHKQALDFLTGYIIEESLSVDNLFVFLIIFKMMGITETNQPHILKWGILSAIVMRIVFILAGVALLNVFHPIIYIFGLVLLYAAYKMISSSEIQIDLDNNFLIKFVRKRFNILTKYEGKKFFVKENGKLFITPLFLTLLLVESADLIFAIDSIPAVLAITHNPFVVITSNIFAVMGLRTLYFALSGLADLFVYLKYGIALILFYIGVKMLLYDLVHIETIYSLAFILICLTTTILISLYKRKKFTS
jgi:tellurite resistance protein TerC